MASGKGTILMTGTTGGLGRAIVSKIISTNELAAYYGIYTARKAESASTLRSTLRSAPATHHYDIESLDLSQLASVRAFANSINSRVADGQLLPIRTLLLTAGCNDMGKQSFTEDGFDMVFAANYLGHWLLALMLLQSMDRENGRIVIVGSATHDVDHHVNKLTGYYNDEKWKTFFDGDNIDTVAKGTWCTNKDAEPQVAGGRRYGAAKICAVMMVAELQRRLDTDSALKNISVVGIDPGSMSTDIVRHGDWFTRTIFFPFIIAFVAQLMTLLQPNPMFRTTAKSANDLIAAAFEVGPRLRGKYLDGTELVDTSREAADVKKRELVWRDSVRYTQLTDRDTMLARWS